jgi:hypothetical protein
MRVLTFIQSRNKAQTLGMMRAVLRIAVLAAAAACVLAEKGDLYGKDGKDKDSIVEQVCFRFC